MSEWSIETTEEYDRRHKRYSKDQPLELRAMLQNVQTVFESLCHGTKPLQMQFGFIHHEPKGIWAIDQKGGKGKLKQTRLYSFADTTDYTFHLITIGDKRTQSGDISFSCKFVDALREASEDTS